MSSFDDLMAQMQRHNMKLPTEREMVRLPNAKRLLHSVMSHFLSLENKPLQWLPEYDQVANWLTDNQGRGLFLYGNCGRGKSLLTRHVLPAILLAGLRKVVNVYDIQDMNRELDELLTKRFIALDDVGTEEVINHFGNRRMAFAEVMDVAEKQGKLLIISSNLQQQELLERYGQRVVDRLKAITQRVLFVGNSLRTS